MSVEEILNLAEQRGLTRWAKIGDGYNYKDDSLNIDVMIYPEKDEFQLEYMIPQSVFRITSDKMGSFSSDKQWSRMITAFRKQVIKHTDSSY